ncbi:hypothetical protein [Allorhodopirellula heiligendammensis]|uniref:Uncharacterized protein n=1 Tax=Allorhodopirellula heiligendammensis TaxID=2714739 RepID=A0A5C6C9Y1_9BACT|nr:hypothetical protein [Allorhodopirellula heiligendammensis]TWU19569.1 hypothetical protein Poly21_17430 [Allorhodopirellula heiligendammensis]
MPELYAFTERQTAERAKELANAPRMQPEDIPDEAIVGWVLRTPTAGIEANEDPDSTEDGKEIPAEFCKAWALVESEGKIYRRKVKNAAGEQLEILAGNMDGEAIAGDKFIRANQVIGGAFLVDYAPCE